MPGSSVIVFLHMRQRTIGTVLRASGVHVVPAGRGGAVRGLIRDDMRKSGG
jgi:hypothetical protein